MFMELQEHQWYDERETQKVSIFKRRPLKGKSCPPKFTYSQDR